MGITETADEAKIREYMRAIWPTDGLVELRALHPSRAPLRGFFDNADDFAREAKRLNDAGWNIYQTINPVRRESVTESLNGECVWGKTTNGTLIAARRTLYLDFDPVRPPDTPSTDIQHQAALDTASDVRRWLSDEYGWPEPLEADSGNGAFLLYSIDLPTDDIAGKKADRLIEQILDKLHERFSRANVVGIDTGVGDRPRVARVLGTINRKGVATEEQPHRLAVLLLISAQVSGHSL